MTSMTTLPNKLRVASQTVMDANATVGLWIDFGSRFETERTNGFGKFIEQMTLRYPSELKKGIKKIGGNLFTDISREQTCYYFIGRDTYICEVLDLFANFLQKPSFDIDTINEMKCAMLREIEEVEGQAGKGIFENLHVAAFSSSPLSKTILGSAENVKSITKEHLEDYISTNYTAPRVVFLACGKYNHRNIVELVKKKFTNLSDDPTTGFQLVAQSPASFTGSEVRVIDDDIKLAQFAIAFKGAAASDRDSITLMVMQKLLGSFSRHLADQPDHGIFGQQIRPYTGVESVMAFNLIYKDIGLFGVNAVATVGVWIDAGSRFETEVPNGTAHFVERMAFWGTPIYTVDELKRKMGNIGGHFISYTSREQTSYYAKVLYSNVSEALDILADFLQNSTFNPSNFMLEREATLCEIKEVEDQPEKVILNHLHAIAFQNTPLSRTILGSAENIKSITQEHLKNYKTTQYTAPRVVISAAGPVEHKDVVNLVKKLFTKLSSDPTTASQLVAKSPASFTGSEVRIIDDDIKLAQFAVAFEGAAVTDPDSIALMVMQAMLGCWSKRPGEFLAKYSRSELVRRVAINDIAESVMAFNINYKDTGLFGVYAVAKPDCLDALSYEIMQSISKLCYSVTDDDVTEARMQVKCSHSSHLDSVISVAKDIGCQMLNYGRIIPAEELDAKIDAVDASAVKRVARRFIFDQDVAIAAIGPVQGLPNYNWFREFTSTKISQNSC